MDLDYNPLFFLVVYFIQRYEIKTCNKKNYEIIIIKGGTRYGDFIGEYKTEKV